MPPGRARARRRAGGPTARSRRPADGHAGAGRHRGGARRRARGGGGADRGRQRDPRHARTSTAAATAAGTTRATTARAPCPTSCTAPACSTTALDSTGLHELGRAGPGARGSPTTPTPATPSWSSPACASTRAAAPRTTPAGTPTMRSSSGYTVRHPAGSLDALESGTAHEHPDRPRPTPSDVRVAPGSDLGYTMSHAPLARCRSSPLLAVGAGACGGDDGGAPALHTPPERHGRGAAAGGAGGSRSGPSRRWRGRATHPTQGRRPARPRPILAGWARALRRDGGRAGRGVLHRARHRGPGRGGPARDGGGRARASTSRCPAARACSALGREGRYFIATLPHDRAAAATSAPRWATGCASPSSCAAARSRSGARCRHAGRLARPRRARGRAAPPPSRIA